MKIRFLHEFGGRETNDIHYQKGDELEIADDIAVSLISRDVVVKVKEVMKEEKPDTLKTTKRAKEKK